jgi:hypothetical protein
MTSSVVQDLFDQTLVGNYDDEAPWDAVSTLRSSGDRLIFETAALWLKSANPLKRARAAAIIAQLRAPSLGEKEIKQPTWLFRDETFPLLVELLEGESDAMVLNSGIAALGHLYNEDAISLIEKYKEHSDEDVRFSVACALGHFPNDPVAISALIALTRDSDSDVRDWAVFGLGVQGDADSPEIRQVLLQGLSDPNEDVREEASVGLGKRQDLRLLPTLRNMLDAPELKVRVSEAASAMLGLPEDPEDWEAEDYKEALDKKFGSRPPLGT